MFNLEIKTGLKKGNPDAYREVFRLLYPRLKGYCKLFIPGEDDVEDIIQDCFLSLWENRKKIDEEKKIESLIFVMLRNRCLNHLKSQRLDSDLINLDGLGYSDLQHLYQLDLNEKEEKTIEEMLIASFQEAVNKLPEKMKAVFVQCKLEGRKQKDVASEMGISIKAIEKQIAKAKTIISDHLKLHHPSMLALILALLN